MPRRHNGPCPKLNTILCGQGLFVQNQEQGRPPSKIFGVILSNEQIWLL